MNDDYVKRADVHKAFQPRYAPAINKTFAAMIDSVPAADVVEVRHGQWVWLSSTYDRIPCEMRYRCSVCHHETITHGHEPWEKFCPNCGAKMYGGQDDGE